MWQCFGCEIMHVGEAVLIAAPGGAYAANSLTARSNSPFVMPNCPSSTPSSTRFNAIVSLIEGDFIQTLPLIPIAISKGIELARVWRRVNFGLSSLGSVYWPNSLCRE